MDAAVVTQSTADLANDRAMRVGDAYVHMIRTKAILASTGLYCRSVLCDRFLPALRLSCCNALASSHQEGANMTKSETTHSKDCTLYDGRKQLVANRAIEQRQPGRRRRREGSKVGCEVCKQTSLSLVEPSERK